MNYELLTALVAFAFVTSVTPGPNNLMLMASGANFGFRRTIPHMLGISCGFTLMVALVGIGLSQVFAIFPMIYTLMRVAGVVFLLYLAWKIATAGSVGEASSGKPFTFWQAAAFQWVNPKAWAMALGALTTYAPGREIWAVLVVAGVFGAVNLPTISFWTTMGREAKRVLNNPLRLKIFNWVMAALLVGSLYPVVMDW